MKLEKRNKRLGVNPKSKHEFKKVQTRSQGSCIELVSDGLKNETVKRP